MDLVTTLAFVAVMGTAAVSDLRTRRIPNWLTLGGLVLALLLRTTAGAGPLLDGLAGAGLGLAVGVVLFVLRALGGGDGKLLMAAGAFFGFAPMVGALLAIGIFGGIVGVFEAVRRGVILPSLYSAGGMLKRWATLGLKGSGPRSLDSAGAVKVPYGLAIAIGGVVWWFWGVSVL